MAFNTKDCEGPDNGVPCPAKRIIPAKSHYCETCRQSRVLLRWKRSDAERRVTQKTLVVRNRSGFPGVLAAKTPGMWIGVVTDKAGKTHRTKTFHRPKEAYKAYLDLYEEKLGERPIPVDMGVRLSDDSEDVRDAAETPLKRLSNYVDQLINIA